MTAIQKTLLFVFLTSYVVLIELIRWWFGLSTFLHPIFGLFIIMADFFLILTCLLKVK